MAVILKEDVEDILWKVAEHEYTVSHAMKLLGFGEEDEPPVYEAKQTAFGFNKEDVIECVKKGDQWVYVGEGNTLIPASLFEKFPDVFYRVSKQKNKS